MELEMKKKLVTNKRHVIPLMLPVCFPHRIKPGCLIRLLRIHFLKLFFFCLALSFSEPPCQSLFYFTYYPLTAHWITAVVLLLIQGKLTDENNGKKFH